MNIVNKTLIAVLLLTIWSCHKEDQSTDVNIRLQLVYNGEPMVTEQNYAYPDGKTFILTKFSTYITDLRLESENNEQKLKDVQLINMRETLSSQANSNEGYLVYSGKTKFNSVNQIHFNFGLSSEQNSTVPADHDPGTPLAMASEYWLAWQSYIFTKIEGWIDLDGDGMAETGVALHLGSDDAMRAIRVSPPSGIPEFMLQIDLATVFAQEGKIYDIATTPQIHSLSQLAALVELSNNLEKSVSIKSPL